MDMIHLPPDFKEFFQLLNSVKVDYLLVGGYAVVYHGYSQATGDIDIWIATNPENAKAWNISSKTREPQVARRI